MKLTISTKYTFKLNAFMQMMIKCLQNGLCGMNLSGKKKYCVLILIPNNKLAKHQKYKNNKYKI